MLETEGVREERKQKVICGTREHTFCLYLKGHLWCRHCQPLTRPATPAPAKFSHKADPNPRDPNVRSQVPLVIGRRF